MQNNRPAMQELQDMPAPTLSESMMEMHSSVMALASLGVSKNLWTEREFEACRLRAQTLLDDEQAKLQAAYKKKLQLMLAEQLRIIQSVVETWCKQQWGDLDQCEIATLRQPLPGDSSHGPYGVAWVLIISDRFTESIESRVQTLAAFAQGELNGIPDFNEAQLNVVPLTHDEVPDSPAYATFQGIVSQLDLVKVGNSYQAREESDMPGGSFGTNI